MPDSDLTRASFIERVLRSSFAGQVAKRFRFADGEVAALYTLSRKTIPSLAPAVVLIIATFPPVLTQTGVHDFGIDYCELPVASADEAAALLTQFDHEQAARFRAKCRAART